MGPTALLHQLEDDGGREAKIRRRNTNKTAALPMRVNNEKGNTGVTPPAVDNQEEDSTREDDLQLRLEGMDEVDLAYCLECKVYIRFNPNVAIVA